MVARVLSFKQADVLRAVKGATAAGMNVGRVEIDPATGRIVLVAAGRSPETQNDPLDRWLASNAD